MLNVVLALSYGAFCYYFATRVEANYKEGRLKAARWALAASITSFGCVVMQILSLDK